MNVIIPTLSVARDGWVNPDVRNLLLRPDKQRRIGGPKIRRDGDEV